MIPVPTTNIQKSYQTIINIGSKISMLETKVWSLCDLWLEEVLGQDSRFLHFEIARETKCILSMPTDESSHWIWQTMACQCFDLGEYTSYNDDQNVKKCQAFHYLHESFIESHFCLSFICEECSINNNSEEWTQECSRSVCLSTHKCRSAPCCNVSTGISKCNFNSRR